MTHGFSYTFPALRGVQAGKEYFVAMCPIGLLPRIFLFDDTALPAELRAQRILNTSRIPEIAQYILHNRSSYAFSAITASIDGEVLFQSLGSAGGIEDLGVLIVPMTARFIINDGQHRRAAIETALEEQPDLATETIAVVFYLDAGLKRTQQLFADLNKHAVKPTRSISILYDYRDPLAGLVRAMAEDTVPFKGLTELEGTTISNRSIKLFTLSSIYQATEALLHKGKDEDISPKKEVVAREFWRSVTEVIPEWKLASQRKVSSAELRRDFVHAHGVTLHAIGMAGGALLQQYPSDWKPRLSALKTVDWTRKNIAVWEGRAMSSGHMSKARQSVQRTAAYIKTVLGVTLSRAEEQAEVLSISS